VSLQPIGPGPASAPGARVLRVKLKAPKGFKYILQVNEDGSGPSGQKSYAGKDGADGEQYTAYDIVATGEVEELVIKLADLMRNESYGNPSGNRRVDPQAVKAVDIILSAGFPPGEIELYSIRFDPK